MSGQLSALSKITSIIKAFREVDPNFPIQQIEVLVWVATRPGVSVAELCDLTGTAQSSVSRNIAALGLVHRRGEPGYDLVDAQKDPNEPRRLIAFLTPKGRQFMAKVIALVDPEARFEAPTYREWASRSFGRGAR